MKNQNLPKTWRKVKLREVLKIRRGASPRPIHEYITKYGMPWLKIADVTSSDSRFVDSTKEFIKKEGVPKSVIVSSGDLILSNSATPGIPKFMRITACVHDGWLILEPIDARINKDFLYYRLIIDREKLISNVTGSIFDNLKTDVLREHEIALPSDGEQKRIADVLSTFDDKIELNNKISRTLEQMAQAIFKEWLLKNQKSNIKNQKLGNLMSLRKEKFKKYEEWKNLKLLDLGRFPQKSLAITTYGKGEEIKTAGIKFKKGDILFGAVRPYFHKVVIAPFDGVTNSSVFVIMPKKENYYALLITILFSENTINYASMSASGTKMPVIKWEDLCSMEILIPEEKIIDSFNRIVKNFYDLIIKNTKENQKLAVLRDLLLPKLMSGEVRV